MKKVIFSIGIPGTGKSTILKKFAQHYDYDYICPDDIREELTGSASDQSKNDEVWNLAYDLLQYSLDDANRTVVFDATQTNPEFRKQFINKAKEYGAEKIQALLFDISLETAVERNSARDRDVPVEVLENMNRSLVDFPPRLDEGIDSIFTLDKEGHITGLQKEFSPKHPEGVEIG